MSPVKILIAEAVSLGVYEFVFPVLKHEKFEICSGSGNPGQHHYGDGGLAKHTLEVWNFAKAALDEYRCFGDKIINERELFVSCVWHDFGKIWDYQKNENGVWGKQNNHARRIHHISRSAIEFYNTMAGYRDREAFRGESLEEINLFIDNVLHNILSHHGCREWGSPVSPATEEAIILHLSDNLSARLNDISTINKVW